MGSLLPLVANLNGIGFRAIVEAYGAASAALTGVLDRVKSPAIHFGRSDQNLLRASTEAASTPFAFVLIDDRSGEIILGVAHR